MDRAGGRGRAAERPYWSARRPWRVRCLQEAVGCHDEGLWCGSGRVEECAACLAVTEPLRGQRRSMPGVMGPSDLRVRRGGCMAADPASPWVAGISRRTMARGLALDVGLPV